MEFIAGSLITFIGIAILRYATDKIIGSKEFKVKLKASQSYNHKMFAPLLLNIQDRRPTDSQSVRHREANRTKIAFTDSAAYWIKDNTVYVADLDPTTGMIIEESTKEVDIMGMDKVQLDEMMFIIEQLTEGQSNDSWSSGDSQF